MFTHTMVGSNDVAKAKTFYDATLGTLGVPAGFDAGTRVFYSTGGPAFGVGKPADGNAASFANGGTIGFAAADKDTVDAFHAAGLAHGGTSEGEPGLRPQAPGKAYGAYLRDPDGNKICAFCQLPE
jgi:catechol 2,3-dioxygenase-like lactoylglutathione lyase family enzyme